MQIVLSFYKEILLSNKRLWDKGNTPALLVGMQAGIAPLDVSVAIYQKIRKQPSSRHSNTTFGYIRKGAQSYHKDMC